MGACMSKGAVVTEELIFTLTNCFSLDLDNLANLLLQLESLILNPNMNYPIT